MLEAAKKKWWTRDFGLNAKFFNTKTLSSFELFAYLLFSNELIAFSCC